MEDDPFYVGNVVVDEPAGVESSDAHGVPVEQLVPPVVLKEVGLQSHLSTAVFGYDIRRMQERPWAKPGAVASDYFNYGFNEKAWRIFCAMQAEGPDALLAKAEDFYRRIEDIAAAHRGHEPMGMAPPYGDGMVPGMPPQGGAPQMQGGMMNRGSNDGYFKTKMCQRFQEGRCTRGATCNYAHGAHELRSGPSGGGPPPMAPPPHQPVYHPMPYPPNDGVLSMPPMNALPPYPPPSGGPSYYPQPPSGACEPPVLPYRDGPPTGFRMAPFKRERSGERHDGVFDPVLK